VRIADCTALGRCGVAWSPDGARIAVSADRRVELVDLDGIVEASFDVDAGRHVTEPAWSPDGAWIVYIDRTALADDDGALRAVRPDGTDDHRVAAPAHPGAIAVDPAWSPDGTSVFYLSQARRPGPNVARGRGDDRPDLQILSVMVTGREEVPSLVDVVGRCWCMGFRPSLAIAPDGSAYLVNTQSMPVPAGGVADGLFLIDATTLEARLLRPGFTNRVTWAPAEGVDGGP
jgi:Tol biopolymer transport system component